MLLRGREKPARRRHPWVFSGAVGGVEGGAGPGDVVRVADADGAFVAWGQYSPHSQIRVRLLEWSEENFPDEGWWRRRVAESLARREGLISPGPGGAFRLVHGEADFLPGVVVDRYEGYLVIQLSTAGAESRRRDVVESLVDLVSPRGVYERSDMESRKLEGLEAATGPRFGEAPPPLLEVGEGDLRLLVDIAGGQKTGAFLDQRLNRSRVARYAGGRELLDAFSYSGSFTLAALKGGAAGATMVDSSVPALDVARRTMELNGLGDRCEIIAADVFEELRRFRDRRRSFDMIVLDPPKLAPLRAQARSASRAYKDINLLAMKLLRPGGILATFSCSGGVPAEEFRTILSWAAADAGREVQVVERLSQGWDHPWRLSFPEAEYLKGFICRVI